MIPKERMTLGQLFEYSRIYPDDFDGILFEQKLSEHISEEFKRIQTKVDLSYGHMRDVSSRMADMEQKIDICRS